MRPLIVLTILSLACATGRDDQLEADSANAANSIKAGFVREKAAAAAAEQAARDSAARLAASTADSIRKAQGLPSDAELLAVVRRLPPDSIDSLPPSVRATLNERKCLIPQSFYGSTRNAITGAFTAKGKVEWAVVCSVQDTSKILILTASTGAVIDSIGSSSPDVNWIQGIGDGKSGYSLQIAKIRGKDILAINFEDLPTDLPKPIDHDAIDVAFLEKASTAYYHARGVWLEFTTSD